MGVVWTLAALVVAGLLLANYWDVSPALLLHLAKSPSRRSPDAPVLLSSTVIWRGAHHNAFGDLVRWRGAWYACCREGASHTSTGGMVRVLRSADFHTWKSVALLQGRAGLRDAHLVETPTGSLLLNTVEVNPTAPSRCRSVLFRSQDGKRWTGPESYGDPDCWIWRLRRFQQALLGVGYSTTPGKGFLRLYRSQDDGRTWTALSDPLTGSYPNETELVFDPDGTLHLLVRRDSGGSGYPTSALWVTAAAPYSRWTTQDLRVRFASPCVVRGEKGALLAAGRFSQPNRFSLAWLDPSAPQLTEALRLAEARDCGYPGLAFYQGTLHLVYHREEGDGAALYSARVRVSPGVP